METQRSAGGVDIGDLVGSSVRIGTELIFNALVSWAGEARID